MVKQEALSHLQGVGHTTDTLTTKLSRRSWGSDKLDLLFANDGKMILTGD